MRGLVEREVVGNCTWERLIVNISLKVGERASSGHRRREIIQVETTSLPLKKTGCLLFLWLKKVEVVII